MWYRRDALGQFSLSFFFWIYSGAWFRIADGHPRAGQAREGPLQFTQAMHDQWATCTTLIILLTGVVSFLAFKSRDVEDRFIFNPESILAWKEYYRLVTSAFLHADWRHLLMNMVSLYFFGNPVELFLGRAQFLLVYFGAVVSGNLLSLYVHRHHDYKAYGASGGVCGVIFAYILLFPGAGISFIYFPIAIPAWLYAICFIVGSFFAMKAGRDNVGHDAHLGGAIVGLLLTAALNPWSVRANLSAFLIVLGAAILLLIYLWLNPLFLPVSSFLTRAPKTRTRFPKAPKYKRENLEIDVILDKITVSGVDSLTPEERSVLDGVSKKYKRRAESKKPQSGLPF